MGKMPDEILYKIAGMVKGVDVSTAMGVYFLCRDAEVVYIGSSKDVIHGICHHKGEVDFDSAFFIPVERKSRLRLIESVFIDLFKPEGNEYQPVKSVLTDKGAFFDVRGKYTHVSNILMEDLGIKIEDQRKGTQRIPERKRAADGKSREKFRRIRRLSCIDDVNEMLMRGMSAPKIADFIRETGSCRDITRMSLVEAVKKYRSWWKEETGYDPYKDVMNGRREKW
jgi:hypothetical protein